jgi:hypothetical protein
VDKAKNFWSEKGKSSHDTSHLSQEKTIVKASDESAAVSIASALTLDEINSKLEKAGLPKVTMLERGLSVSICIGQNWSKFRPAISPVSMSR